jgi:hypothetical protein
VREISPFYVFINMTEQSQFSKLPKKQLVFISEKLVDEDFPIGNPYGDFEDAYKTLKSVSKYFNIEPSQEDVEFFSKFLEINGEIIADLFANNREQMRNKELIEKLEIPLAKTFDMEYEVDGSCTYTEYLSQEFDCYDKFWVRDSADQQRNDGNWDTYDGRERSPTDYENYEVNDFTYGDVYEVYDDGDGFKLRRESILGKLIVENTKDVVDSLDKKTLLELRRVIDSKLRLL